MRPTAPRIDPCARIRFCAPSRIVGQNRGGRIVADEGFVLADGGLTRWVGGIDLAVLREATTGEPDLPELLRALDRRGVSGTSASGAHRVGAAQRRARPARERRRRYARHGETAYTS